MAPLRIAPLMIWTFALHFICTGVRHNQALKELSIHSVPIMNVCLREDLYAKYFDLTSSKWFIQHLVRRTVLRK